MAVGRSRMAAAALVVALAVACWCAPSAIAGDRVVDAGALQAGVQSDSWRLTFTDRRGRNVLAEAPGTGTGEIGALGFRTADGWFRATRVRDASEEGKSFQAALDTTDPAGRRITVRLTPQGGGVIALDAEVVGADLAEITATGISFEATRRERYLGFGERSNAVDQRGNVVENYVTEGPFQEKDYGIGEFGYPEWGFRPRVDGTNYPIPWLLSSGGYGVLVDSPETSYFHLDGAGSWSVELVTAPSGEAAPANAPPPSRLEMRFFAGPKPADVLRRFTRATGRQPPAAAPWVFGPWVQPTGDTTEQVEDLDALRAADAPLSVAQTYLHYLPCGVQRGRRDAERERTAAIHDRGVAVTTYFNPMLCTDYEPVYGEAAARDGLTLAGDGEPYVYRYFGDRFFDVSQFDFDQPAGREVFASVLAEAIADGHDGWMEDYGEFTPLDSRSVAGVPGTQLHNVYPREFHCAAYEAIGSTKRPLVRFQRSGWTGAAPCAQVVWGADPSTVWEFDGLASAVRQALTMGLSGISTWGSDIGGFWSLGDDALSPELLARWIQFGAVSGVMRTQAEGGLGRPRPQVWEADQINNWRLYTKLRTQLYPYIAAADATYGRTGVPIMRHLALRWPGDPRAVAREDEFLFGPDLLAAPVLDPGLTERELYLPGGRWVEFWDAIAYKQKSGDFALGKARLVRGKRSRTVSAEADELPLMVRAGTLLPLLPADVDTLADRYADGEAASRGSGGGGQVSLADRKHKLDVLAFPRGRSVSRAYGNGKLISRERGGKWRLKIKGKQRRRYTIDASLATLRRPFVPECVTVRGKPLSGKSWSYSKGKRLVRIKVRAKRTAIAVRARCKA